MPLDLNSDAMLGQDVGPYRLIDRLGGGQTGVVFLATHGELSHRVAIKFRRTSDRMIADPDEEFQREIAILKALNSSHVVQIHDAGEFEGVPYFVMDFVNGDTLRTHLDRGLGKDDLFNFMAQLLRGLIAIHEPEREDADDAEPKPIVHRDIKPKNIMITRDELLKIVDFGFARLTTEAQTPQEQLHEEGVITNRRYLDPLQGTTAHPKPISDIYSAGKILEEGVTRLTGPGQELSRAEADAVKAIVRKATAPASTARGFERARDMLEELRNVSDLSFVEGTDREALRLLITPELVNLRRVRRIVRLPELEDAPFTPRVQRLVDTPEMQHLRRVSQLGLVSLVYPGATHTRFEHCLGAFSIAARMLRHLVRLDDFRRHVGRHEIDLMLVSALIHDVGQYPFAHAIEEMKLQHPIGPKHEERANSILRTPDDVHMSFGGLKAALEEDWGVEPDEIDMIATKDFPPDPAMKIAKALLSGPVACDVVDYLQRDSVHAGVPYGRQFDVGRLVGSLVLSRSGEDIAVSEKGRASLEALIVARCTMFTEVYWHHTARASTAMLQRAIYHVRNQELPQQCALDVPNKSDELFARCLLEDCSPPVQTTELLTWLGMNRDHRQRKLFKRVATFSALSVDSRDIALYEALQDRDYTYRTHVSNGFAAQVTATQQVPQEPHKVLLDVPPIEQGPQTGIEVYYPKEGEYFRLGKVAPTIEQLAKEFDHHARKVRLFCHPDLLSEIRALDVRALLEKAINNVNAHQQVQ